jgi:hypothetical protein
MIRNKLGRRAFLGGAGAAVALPFLPSLFPSRAEAGATVPVRLLAWYVPCGTHMASWRPSGQDRDWTLTPTLQPLAGVKSKVTVISGLANRPAQPDGPGDHASGTGAYLTAAHPFKTSGADIRNGISVDQVAAQAIGSATRFPSLELGISGGDTAGDCDSGYSCAYARNISWSGPATPLPKITDPQAVFERLFAGFDPDATSAELEKRRVYQTSVLDYAREEATSLKARLGRTDRLKLDEYLTAVREVETRVAMIGSGPICSVPGRPEGGLAAEAKIDVMADLQVLALQCDQTRIITFMMDNAGSGRNYGFLPGVSGGHHDLSHHGGNEGSRAMLAVIDHWEMQRLARMLDRMDEVIEADGSTLLDNVVLLYSGEISDGDRHNHNDMPVLLAGGAGGAWETDRHIVFDAERSFGDLFLTMLGAVGAETDRIGDSTGPLPL